MYGCGSTEHGELPYLRFSGGAGDSDCDDDSLPRSEICVPTRLRLPFLQVCWLPFSVPASGMGSTTSMTKLPKGTIAFILHSC